MSTIVLYPANGYDYDAADVAAYNAPRTSGVYSSDEDFVVAAAGGMDVTVSAGIGWVRPERFAGYSIVKREADTLTLPLADGTRPRIDRIVLRYDAASRKASLQVLTGDPASTPTAPAITRTALVYDLCLAEITRPAGSTTVTAANITDTRTDESLCGVMSDGVTRIPTDALLAAAKERINALEEKASTSAAAAKASEDAAAQSEQNAATSEKNAGNSEAAAKQALKDTQKEHSQAISDIAQARSTALNDVAASTEKAAAEATTASEQASAAAGSASKAAASASEAANSKTAAATSETNAKVSEDNAKKYAEEAGAKAGTDKTFTVEGAPADAKATGEALAGKADKESTEQALASRYTKAEVERLIKEMLAAQREEDYAKIRFWASPDPTSPASIFGGTWERIEGRFIMGASDEYPAGSTGGISGHYHTASVKYLFSSQQVVGGSQAFSVNMLDSANAGLSVAAKKDPDYSASLYFATGNYTESTASSWTSTGTTSIALHIPPYYSMYIWRRVA